MRTERLLLLPPTGGAPVELATATRTVGAVDSQDELAVSPDGRYLAWTTPEDERLHLRDPEGHDQVLARYGRRMRFSPDGKWLAAITDVGRGDWHKLIVWELATGHSQSLITVSYPGRFEWTRDGIVIARGSELVHVPLAGDPRVLFKAQGNEYLERFTAAATSSRVILVTGTERAGDRSLNVRALDLDHPDRIRRLGTVPGTGVDNAEQSPDGNRVVLATTRGLYVIDGDRTPRELSNRRDVHSLWFAPDGRMAYASPLGATVLDGRRARRLEPRDPIQMMRFEHGSARVLVAAGRDVRAWDPESGQQTLLASAQPGEQALGADRYQGGVVLWTGREGDAQPHRIVRVLRATDAGTTTELERIEGQRAVDLVPHIQHEFRFFATSADARSIAYPALSGGAFRVRAGDGTERTVAASSAELSPEGDHILVSRPDGSMMAQWSLVDTETGGERALFRTLQMDVIRTQVAFSGDGKWLAVRGDMDRRTTLVMIDVATGKQRTIPDAEPWSWTARGLLVSGRSDLALVSPSGDLRAVLDEPVKPGLASVTTNTAGARLLVCFRSGTSGAHVHPGVLLLDLDAPLRPVEIDVPDCRLHHVWLSPDGQHVLFTGHNTASSGPGELQLRNVKEGGQPRELGDLYPDHDVIFDGRGRLAFVSRRGVRVTDGKRDGLFETDGPVESLQFRADSSLVFAVGREVIAWDPAKATRTVLARAPEGQRIRAAVVTTTGVMLATVE